MITNMQQLTIYDGAATPVGHIFSPASNGARSGVARWVDKEHNGGVALGFSVLDFSVREPAKPDGVTRVRMGLAVPKLDTSTTVPKVVGMGRGNIEFIFPASFTAQDRKDLRAFLTNALNANQLGENISEMQTPY